ncbi:MAG TPA: hypothetical protein EYG86_05480 [Crocinitomicaceae bacterium]|nr:hypothetical protein [Crocinitomicaceae bacterium]
MVKKFLLIILLAGIFAALLYYKPWKSKNNQFVQLEDRLPVGSIIGQSNILNLSNDLSKTMFYYELPYRDVISPNIILSQAKKFGLDVQAPVFFFANDSLFTIKEWGVITSVQDSIKAALGITQLKKYFALTDTLIADQHVFYSPEFRIYVSYSKDWFLAYQGDDIGIIVRRVCYPKPGNVHPRWSSFIASSDLSKDDLTAEIKSNQLSEFGIESAVLSMSNDSTSFIFNTQLIHSDTLAFQLKQQGASFEPKEFTKQLLNFHFDIEQLRKNKKHPYRAVFDKIGGKINFPADNLLDCWTGDIAIRRGGIQTIYEKHIVSELDDDFNITEVEKVKEVQITGFALQISTNNKGRSFVKQLLKKGILSEDGEKYRLLYSPPLKLKKTDSTLTFYTGKYRPNVISSPGSKAIWDFNYTPVEFFIDSTSTKVIFGRIRVPLKKIVRDVIP